MKLSELTVEQAMAYAVVSDDAPDAALFQGYLESAKNYALEYTGLDASAADSKPELAMAALVVFAELVRSKEGAVDSDKVNPLLESFLGMHAVNLL
jgi:hypothetical protein|nr:MAG TPA: hypothetical protein [Caudoviricetes sp.]